MDKNQVVELMKSSNNENEWNQNCDKVKAACGGYPDFWYASAMLGGALTECRAKWGQEPKKTTVEQTPHGAVMHLGDPDCD